MSSDFQSISNGIERWTRRLKGKDIDMDYCDFMVSKFQCHMEEGLFNTPVSDTLDVGYRILHWDTSWIVNGMNYETSFCPLLRHLQALCRSSPQTLVRKQ